MSLNDKNLGGLDERLYAEQGVIKAQSELDLREYTPEALSKIKLISAVALVILPKDAGSEFYNAYSQICKKAIAHEIKLNKDEKINNCNGCAVINGNMSGVNMVNGIAVITDCNRSEPADFYVNGMVIIKKGCNSENINIVNCNGAVQIIDFNCVKVYADNCEINDQFIEYIEKDTLICAGDNVIIDKSVTPEMLCEKNIQFVAGDFVICPKKIYGAVAVRSFAGDGIKTKR